MWVMVYFDLPTELKDDKKLYTQFRKNLLKSGFKMFQFSIYVRHCLSMDIAEKYKKGIVRLIPPKGHVVISLITDKQFGAMEIHYGEKKLMNNHGPYPELEFF